MKQLLYYIPHRLLKSEAGKDINPVTKEFLLMFNPWISLSDRTGTIDIPGIDILNNSPIPDRPNFVPEFAGASYSRIDDCIERFNSQCKKRLVVFYSGGIDSTLIVSLLISHPKWNEIKDSVWLAVNEDSQVENPDFFREIVLPNFGTHLLPSNGYYDIITNQENLCITGECADNLFGSLTLKSYMDNVGDYNCIHEPWETTSLNWLLDKRKLYRDQREQMLYDLVNAAPINIETNHDFLWWLNFAMKWQAVKYRMAMHAPTAVQAEYIAGNVINFFDSTQYQQWALYTTEQKVAGTWNSYKLPAKTLINEIWTNEKYMDYKTKWPSLPTITRYNNAWGFLYQNNDGSLTATKELD